MTRLALAIATKGAWDAHQLLQDLRTAGADASTEMHIGCDPEHAPAEAPRELVIHPQANASLFDLWGAAIAGTSADWVAILHADALPARGWFAAMKHAIDSEGWNDGYWGPVEPAFEPSDKRMIGYLTEYCQFHRPIATNMKEVPGSNLVLPRRRLAVSGGAFSKTRLLGEGLAPKPVEGAKVQYARAFRLADYCWRRFRHGRAYAAKRTPKLPLVEAIPLSFVLPFVRTGRVLGHARRYGQASTWLGWMPAIFIAETCWSAGELTGYTTRHAGDESKLD